MPDILQPGFNPGALLPTPKASDLLWSSFATAYPPFDWDKGYDIEVELSTALGISGFKLPIKNQNGSGSCGGQAYSQADGVIEAFSTKTFEERSAKYVIAQTFVVDANGVMLGSGMNTNSDILKKQGVSREVLCPSYDNGVPPSDSFMNRPQDITENAKADAKLSRARSYAYLFSPTLNDIAQAIALNNGVVMCLGGENNGTWTTAEPKVPTYRQWGHFMFFGKAKIRNGKPMVGAIQSWGPNIGENGWQWFGDDWFTSGYMPAGNTFIFDDSIILPPAYQFTRDLKLGSTGIDVRVLQAWLNAHGYPVATSGAGSPGNETSYFGVLTQSAVKRFQVANGITPAAGYFGPITRAKVNSLQ